MRIDEPIRLIQLSGAPRERGVQYGRALGEELTRYWNDTLADVGSRDRSIDEGELKRWIADRAQMALRAAPDLEDEVRGIAEGAEVPYEVALGVTFGEEAVDLGGRSGSPQPWGTRCLSLTVPAAQSKSGNFLHLGDRRTPLRETPRPESDADGRWGRHRNPGPRAASTSPRPSKWVRQ